MKLWHKIGTTAAALALSIFGFAAPAQASIVHNCAEDFICLYQWINYGADKWYSSFYNLSIHTNGCVSLWTPLATWDNGTVVHDNSGSMVINGSGAYSQNVSVSVYGWDHCDSRGGIASFNANWATSIADLRDLPIGNGVTAYHNIASIKIDAICGPPGSC